MPDEGSGAPGQHRRLPYLSTKITDKRKVTAILSPPTPATNCPSLWSSKVFKGFLDIYIYIYTCTCVCTYIYIYIYIWFCQLWSTGDCRNVSTRPHEGMRACYIRLRSGWGSDGNVYNVLRGLRYFWDMVPTRGVQGLSGF